MPSWCVQRQPTCTFNHISSVVLFLFTIPVTYFLKTDTHADLLEFSGSSTDGHRVMGVACLSGHYPTQLQHLTWNVPHSWNLKQAATVPLAYSMVSNHHCSFSDLGYSKYKSVNVPYILESNPHPNLIRTSFCRFLK